MIVTIARGKTWSSEKLVLCCFHYIMNNFIFHMTMDQLWLPSHFTHLVFRGRVVRKPALTYMLDILTCMNTLLIELNH